MGPLGVPDPSNDSCPTTVRARLTVPERLATVHGLQTAVPLPMAIGPPGPFRFSTTQVCVIWKDAVPQVVAAVGELNVPEMLPLPNKLVAPTPPHTGRAIE